MSIIDRAAEVLTTPARLAISQSSCPQCAARPGEFCITRTGKLVHGRAHPGRGLAKVPSRWEVGASQEVDRFWSCVDKSGECWIWTKSRWHFGYGKFYLSPSGPGEKAKCVRAHRYAYEIVNGPIPDGMFLLHSCDNPPCVNPAHLRPGDQVANMADAKSRGRLNNGQVRKTHCPQGHPYDERNTYVDRKGKRYCRACTNARRNRNRNGASRGV